MTREALFAAIADALHPAHFFVPPGGTLRFQHAVKERCRWEIFRGHLLDPAQTRAEHDFTSWHVFVNDADEPLLSVKHSAEERCVCVVRAIRINAREAVEADGVIDTWLTQKWHRELVGRVDPDLVSDLEFFRKALARLLVRAVVGTSRLPITSLESPLPQFSLGTLCYASSLSGKHAAGGWHTEPMAFLAAHLAADSAPADRARLVEFLLRVPQRAAPAVVRRRFHRLWQDRWLSGDDFAETMKALFRQVALTPLTGFNSRWTRFLAGLGRREFFGLDLIRRLFGYMLRHLVRHLTAFDLRIFHNRGANYPDALLLDVLLRCFLSCAAEDPPAARQPLFLRALRMAWIARKEIEGLPVPDQPTSPGENLRVLPPPFAPVDESQLFDPQKRTKRLFANEPAEELLTSRVRELLDEALAELNDPRELRELGMAVFLDRPLGIFKQPGEVDRTPLLSHEAFSSAIARRRLDDLLRLGWLAKDHHEQLIHALSALEICGIPAGEMTGCERPGVVALEDARRASADFVFLRTTRSSLQGFEAMYGALPVRGLTLLIRSPRSRRAEKPRAVLTGYDADMRPRLDLGVAGDGAASYVEFAGVEFLRDGLDVLCCLNEGEPAAASGDLPVLRPVYESALNYA